MQVTEGYIKVVSSTVAVSTLRYYLPTLVRWSSLSVSLLFLLMHISTWTYPSVTFELVVLSSLYSPYSRSQSCPHCTFFSFFPAQTSALNCLAHVRATLSFIALLFNLSTTSPLTFLYPLYEIPSRYLNSFPLREIYQLKLHSWTLFDGPQGLIYRTRRVYPIALLQTTTMGLFHQNSLHFTLSTS